MTPNRLGAHKALRLVALPVLIAALAGCGNGANRSNSPRLQQLPLVPGAKVVTQVRQCDGGANAFCALELVVVDPHYKTSDDLLKAEHVWVHAAGWHGVGGDTENENSAESPGHKLRVTYATAYEDLKGIDLGFIHRPRSIAVALSRAMFAHSSAISVLLEAGDSS